MIVTIDGIPVYRAELNGDDTGMYCISLVDEPAVLRDFQRLSKQEREDREATRQLYSITDEDRHLVRGVVMRADFPIYRRDTYEYYIIYKADTIREMAEKYLADKLQNQVNLDHTPNAYVEGVQMVQWYLKDTAAGINPEGFEDCAEGSLFAEFHITDEEIWKAIKAGTYRGFSLEGYFELQPEQDEDDIERIVEETHGLFKKLSKLFNMSKFIKVFNAMRQAVAFRSVTSDKGILAWEGDEDLKVGDAVFIEDEEGNRTPAADDTYTLTDGTVVIVVDGRVESIAEVEAPVEEEAPAAPEEEVVEAAEEEEVPEVPAPDAPTEETTPDAIEELRKEMNEAYARIDALERAIAEVRERLDKVEAQPAAVEAHKAVSTLASARDIKRENLARILNARRK